MSENNGETDEKDNQVCLSSFKKHWAETQIDSPMQMIARYDDVSKLLITIGGFVLGALATMLREHQAYPTPLIIAVLFLILLFFFFAVRVCYFQPAIRAKEILIGIDDNALAGHINAWCDDLQRVINRKRSYLYATVACFALSFLLIMALLLFSSRL